MIKKLFRILRYPLSIITGGYTYYWLITNPFESYSLPIIIYWIPDVIGWHGFFIFLGILAGLIMFVICSSLAGKTWMD